MMMMTTTPFLAINKSISHSSMPTTVKDHQTHTQQWSTASRLQIQIKLNRSSRSPNHEQCACSEGRAPASKESQREPEHVNKPHRLPGAQSNKPSPRCKDVIQYSTCFQSTRGGEGGSQGSQ